MKVLAVEEDALTALLLHEALERCGHAATIVRDPEAAWLQLIQETSPGGDARRHSTFDVLIASNSPAGLSLLQRIRHPQIGLADLPIVLAVERETPETQKQVAAYQIEAVLKTPVEPEDVLKLLRRLLERPAAPPAVTPPTPDDAPESASAESMDEPTEPVDTRPPAAPLRSEPISTITPPAAGPVDLLDTEPSPAKPSPPTAANKNGASKNGASPNASNAGGAPATTSRHAAVADDSYPIPPPLWAADAANIPTTLGHEAVILDRTDLQSEPESDLKKTSDDPENPSNLPARVGPARDGRPGDGGFGQRERLGSILVNLGFLTPGQLSEALEIQQLTRERLGTILVGRNWVTDRDIAAAYSQQVDMPFVDMEHEPIFELALAAIPREASLRHLVIALPPALDDTRPDPAIRVAIADPWNIAAIDLVQGAVRRRVQAVLAEEGALRRAIEQAYTSGRPTFDSNQLARSIEESVSGLTGDVQVVNAASREDDEAAITGDQTPVIRFVNSIIVEAVRRRASDIHIEPYKRDFEVRYRIDGQLHVIHTLPHTTLSAVAARIKVLSDLDIAERRLPQDGRVTLRVDNRSVQFRVSTLPNQFGERVVLRVLDRGGAAMQIEQLSFSDENLTRFEGLIRRPHGIVLVTGPTGSGKTTTLYAALNALKSPTTNIMTCEDPIEYEMDRISQSNVNPKAGLTFATQLRAILRQDPDVVLVGEIRDSETAEIAFKAALTGHLVLSTLHCNESGGAMTRLVDMGIEPYLISSALNGAVAQRLARRLCPHCRVFEAPTSEERVDLEKLNGGIPVDCEAIGKPVGCARCNQIGTLGRVGIHEVLSMSERLQGLNNQRATTSALQLAAIQEGMTPMIGDGLQKVIEGVALLEDVKKKVLAG